jgi:hypothetical protein
VTEVGEGVAVGGEGAAQAQALIEASEAGTPFCEVCEKSESEASNDPPP